MVRILNTCKPNRIDFDYYTTWNMGSDLDCAIREAEPLLHNSCEFPDSTAFFTKHILCPGGENNDLCSSWGHSYFDTRVAIFRELSREEVIELSLKYTVRYELQGRIDICTALQRTTHHQIVTSKE